MIRPNMGDKMKSQLLNFKLLSKVVNSIILVMSYNVQGLESYTP